MSRALLLSLLAGLFFTCGCILQKRRDKTQLSGESVERIITGKTTIGEVAGILGAPDEVIWSNGVTTLVGGEQGVAVVNTFVAETEGLYERAYHYRYAVQKMSGFTLIVFSMMSYDNKYDDVFVFFNKSGVVTHVGSSLNSPQVSYNPFGD